MPRRRLVVLGLFAATALAVTAGCESPETSADEPGAVNLPDDPSQPHAASVPGAAGTSAAAAAAPATADFVPTRVALPRRAWTLGLHHATLVDALYRDRNHATWLVGTAAPLSPRGQVLLETLRTAPTHALDPADFHVPTIEAHLASLAAATGDVDAQRELTSDLELLLADALLHWGHTLRHHNPAAIDDVRRRAEGDARLVRAMMLQGFEQAVAADSVEAFTAHLDALAPTHVQYRRLQNALARYLAIEAAGGWPTVEPPPRERRRGDDDDRLLRSGDEGPAVTALQQRLAAEGYYTGAVDGVFGGELERALEAYQNTHQLSDDGDVEPEDLASLNKPVELRIAELEVSLARWRSSRIGDDTYYIHVNLPDFHAEVIHDGERVQRFPVIVGNTSRWHDDERNVDVYINSTPLMSAALDFVIFNPWWNVTPRVAREIDAKVAEEPGYLEANDFVVEGTSSGSRRYRQKPGPKNALGVVKFQFPNRHDVYMHDTDKPWLFRHPVRSFSHGCIRVSEPLELAETLLRYDDRHSAKWRVQQYLAPGTEDWTELTEGAVPVHIEYYTVRVDDEDRVHFGADIYRYDKPLVRQRLEHHGWLDRVEDDA